jgi:hypothetical protein
VAWFDVYFVPGVLLTILPGVLWRVGWMLHSAVELEFLTTTHIANKLLGPDGQVLLDVPDYHTTDQTVFYHPATFFLRHNFQLDLPSGAPKGTHTEQFVVTDRQANATLNYEGKLEVK